MKNKVYLEKRKIINDVMKKRVENKFSILQIFENLGNAIRGL